MQQRAHAGRPCLAVRRGVPWDRTLVGIGCHRAEPLMKRYALWPGSVIGVGRW